MKNRNLLNYSFKELRLMNRMINNKVIVRLINKIMVTWMNRIINNLIYRRNKDRKQLLEIIFYRSTRNTICMIYIEHSIDMNLNMFY